jgi:hypothetical protein
MFGSPIHLYYTTGELFCLYSLMSVIFRAQLISQEFFSIAWYWLAFLTALIGILSIRWATNMDNQYEKLEEIWLASHGEEFRNFVDNILNDLDCCMHLGVEK